jgi:hypothetical protein
VIEGGEGVDIVSNWRRTITACQKREDHDIMSAMRMEENKECELGVMGRERGG